MSNFDIELQGICIDANYELYTIFYHGRIYIDCSGNANFKN